MVDVGLDRLLHHRPQVEHVRLGAVAAPAAGQRQQRIDQGGQPVGLADDVGDLVDRLVVEQHAAQNRLLSLDRMRRQFQGIELRIVRHGGYEDLSNNFTPLTQAPDA